MKNLSELLPFFEKIGELKKIQRTGWKRWGISNAEHVSDHAFRMSVMAMFFAKELKCNEQKLVQLALVHDLHESICGDLILDYSSYHPKAKGLPKKEKKKIERKAMEKLAKLLPKEKGKKFKKLWIEAEKGKTREGKILRELDKLEMLLQAAEYERESNNTLGILPAFLRANQRFIKEDELKRFLEKMGQTGREKWKSAGKV